MSDESIALHKKYEDFRNLVYDDATGKPIGPGSTLIGHPSIGYGRALDVAGILPSEGDILCANSDKDAENDLKLIFAARWDGIGNARQAALIDMRYGLGAGGFREFHRMITALFNQKWDEAAVEMLNSKWARQVGQRANDLAQMVKSGEWLDG